MASRNAPQLFILVADLERFASSPVGPHLDAVTVVVDALNRQWVSDGDARILIERAEAEWQEECRLRSEHQAYLTDRQARRTALAQKVANDLGGGTTPESSARIQQAVWAAVREFDATEGPERGFYEWKEAGSRMASAR